MSHTSIRCRSSPNPEQTSCEKQFTKQRGVTVSLLPPAAATPRHCSHRAPAAHGQTRAPRPAGRGAEPARLPARRAAASGMAPTLPRPLALLAVSWDSGALALGHSATWGVCLTLSESVLRGYYYLVQFLVVTTHCDGDVKCLPQCLAHSRHAENPGPLPRLPPVEDPAQSQSCRRSHS